MPYSTYPFELPPLPYQYDSLEPYIDTETMHYHHDKHFKAYIDNLNKALEPFPQLQKLSLGQLLTMPLNIPSDSYTKIMNNGGGVYNHTLFFRYLSPVDKGLHAPNGLLLSLINRQFGSFEDFKKLFSQNALSVFGSGWTYLVLTLNNQLKIINLKDQVTPLNMNVTPIILFDVWEHAYYLKYKNLRADYIKQLWNVMTFPDMHEIRAYNGH